MYTIDENTGIPERIPTTVRSNIVDFLCISCFEKYASDLQEILNSSEDTTLSRGE
jgi:hypothetical protein